MNYFEKCEALFESWRSKDLVMDARLFETDVVPEPYLLFGSGEKPLYQLLTNPGTGMPEIQLHSAVEKLGVRVYISLAHRVERFY